VWPAVGHEPGLPEEAGQRAGAAENADDVECRVNQPMADSWFYEDASRTT
jgi:hypothetical protein